MVIVLYSGSVALLADTIHNFGDALTAIPLWVAFRMSVWKPTKRYTYGYGRVEDLAGIAIVLTILFSAVLAGYASFDRLFHPQAVRFVWAVIIASLIGFVGNEVVAVFRIRVGKEIESAALIADGHHARIDGLTSLAVFLAHSAYTLGTPAPTHSSALSSP
jgi:cation diffusion facilitator family transporter